MQISEREGGRERERERERESATLVRFVFLFSCTLMHFSATFARLVARDLNEVVADVVADIPSIDKGIGVVLGPVLL